MEKFLDDNEKEHIIALKHRVNDDIYIITNEGEIFLKKESYEKCSKNDEVYKTIKQLFKVDNSDVM